MKTEIISEKTDAIDHNIINSRDKVTPTKQKILISAADLFATKGYTETSIRDIASTAGIKSSSMYNHFLSKEDLLEYMLTDFNDYTRHMFNNPDVPIILQQNPTLDGILSCFQISFAVLSDDYYLKMLHVIYHEQHRNTIVRSFVVKIILEAEGHIERIFAALKNLSIIRQDADPDFYKKAASSLLYAFPSRTMLGIGEDSADFSGMDLKGLLSDMFDTVLKLYGNDKNR